VLTTTGRRADAPPTTRRERIAVAVVTVTFGLWLLVWALVVPVFQAPDETAHVDATVHLAIGDAWVAPGEMHVLNAVQAAAGQQATLPKAEWSDFAELLAGAPGESSTVDQMTQHPPTAYLVGALVLKAVHFADLRWDHAVLVLRLVDVAAVTLLPLLTWASVRRLTRSPRAAVVGALALFATPQLASIASSVSNDAPVMLVAGIVVWLSVRLLTGDLRWRTTVALAVALGALIWIKGTGLPAIPFVAVVVLVAGAGVLPLARRVVRTVVTLGIAAVVGAWWWLHNLLTSGQVQPNGYTAMRPPKDFPPGEHPTLAHFLDVSWGTLARTFWGSPGIKAQVSIGDLLTSLLTLVALVAVVVFAFRRGAGRREVLVLAVFPALLIGIQTYTSAHAYLTTTEVAATQGRYYFPAIVCLIALSAVAWGRLAPAAGSRGRDAVAVGLAIALPAVGLYGLGVASSWFWNAARGPLTAAGITRYEALGPVPPVLVGALVLLVLVGLAVTVVAVVRTGGAVPVADERRPVTPRS
jgi:4-amino-4-deoxy-L-arabinose transferase-like glycosyltransferase